MFLSKPCTKRKDERTLDMKLAIRKSISYGLVTGLILAILLKVVEQLTSYKVYTLLLNVDYIPILNDYQFPETVEVGFHLIISVAVSICLYFFLTILKINSRRKIIVISTSLNILIGALLFPTTAFSDRTPEITSISSIFYWLVAHGVYGYLLGYLFAQLILKDQKK